MVEDGRVLLDNSGADLWVVQKDTLGPYAESSSVPDDLVAWHTRHARGCRRPTSPTTDHAGGKGDADVRAWMVVGISPGALTPAPPAAGCTWRQITRGHYEATWPTWPPALQGDVLRGSAATITGWWGSRGAWCLQRRPDGVHPASGRTGGAVSEGQRRHPDAAPPPHRGQPGLQPPGRAGLAGRGDCLADQQQLSSTPCWCA